MPDFLRAVRPRPDWLPRASVGLGVAATIAMNVAAGSRGGLGGALLGTLPPVGFVISLETLIWLVRRLARVPWGWAWCAGAGIPLAGLAGITGVISYLHALTVAQWTGDQAEAGLVLTEHLLPLVADLMIVTGSVALVALAVAAKTPAGAGREASGHVDGRVLPSREGPAPRQPAGKARQRKQGSNQGRTPSAFPPVPPERLPALLAMTERDLAAELDITRWKAVQFKKQYAVNGANGS